MKAAPARPPRRETLNLRIPAAERNLIDRAALTSGKTRTDFILEAARRAAEEALLDHAILAVDAQTYAKFLARLDAPPQPNARLRRTMQTRVPWSRG
ncbi:protein containing DUF1778 [mine drainage metagenome]|uniref:Protein containing DUF1778 n=2 Tax=mine drainage metagenome TaxID=410659 RepID=T0ZB65_9ZZZZ